MSSISYVRTRKAQLRRGIILSTCESLIRHFFCLAKYSIIIQYLFVSNILQALKNAPLFVNVIDTLLLSILLNLNLEIPQTPASRSPTLTVAFLTYPCCLLLDGYITWTWAFILCKRCQSFLARGSLSTWIDSFNK